mgnify:FL=1
MPQQQSKISAGGEKMLNIIRPELKHLKQIVLLSKDVYGSKAPDHVLHDFFKSLLVNLNTFMG